MIDIFASLGLDNGVWYAIRQGMRGLVVADESGQERIYVVCEPASHYYGVMTLGWHWLVLTGERISTGRNKIMATRSREDLIHVRPRLPGDCPSSPQPIPAEVAAEQTCCSGAGARADWHSRPDRWRADAARESGNPPP